MLDCTAMSIYKLEKFRFTMATGKNWFMNRVVDEDRLTKHVQVYENITEF